MAQLYFKRCDMKKFWNWIKTIFGVNDQQLATNSLSPVGSLFAKWTGSELTGAEREANAFSAAEAQKNRDFQAEMSNTAYQRAVTDMRAAGVNPALAMSQGGANTPSGATAQSTAPSSEGISMSDLMQLAMVKPQIALMKDQGEAAKMQGQAALENAAANRTNAETKKGELENEKRRTDIFEKEVSIKQKEYEVHRSLADSNIAVNAEMVNKIAKESQRLQKDYEQMDAYLEVARTSANAAARSAAAAWENAQAALTNAATNSYLSSYQADVLVADQMLKFVSSEQGKVLLDYLPESERLRVENLAKEGINLGKQGEIMDKSGKLLTARMIHEYVAAGAQVVDSALSVVQSAATGGMIHTPSNNGGYVWNSTQ